MLLILDIKTCQKQVKCKKEKKKKRNGETYASTMPCKIEKKIYNELNISREEKFCQI